jgi:inosine-uridine nucleoside N-ribohydrolase
MTSFGVEYKNNAVETVIIDSDGGLSVADLFVIARALNSDDFVLAGITAVHNQLHPQAGDSSMLYSLKKQKALLEAMNRTDIIVRQGAGEMLAIPPPIVPKPTEASDFIIQTLSELPGKEKLTLFCLGPLTNLATVLLEEPEMASRLKVYYTGALYDSKTRVWNKNELNCRSDLHALDIVLNTTELDLTVMPSNISSGLVMTLNEVSDLLGGVVPPWNYLYGELREQFPDSTKVSLNELALIEALIEPEYAKKESTSPPPENIQHSVRVFSRINGTLMNAQFSAAVLKDKRRSKAEGGEEE